MHGGLGHLCAHIAGPREPPEDGEMNEMTLPFRHRIRNSIPVALRSSTLPLGHGDSPQHLIFTSERFVSLKLEGQSPWVGFEPAISDFPSRQL